MRNTSKKLMVVGALYYLLGAFGAVATLAAVPVIRNMMGAIRHEGAPPLVNAILEVILMLSLAASVLMGGCVMFAGYAMRTNRHRMFCVVISALICLSVPIGTVIGGFALIVLSKPDVKGAFTNARNLHRPLR